MNDVQPTVVRVREGQIVDAEWWVYAWFNTQSRRVASRYPRFNIEPLDVLAFPLPVEVSRPVAKAACIDKPSGSGLLSDDYVGQIKDYRTMDLRQ